MTEKNVTDAFKEFHDKTKTGYVTIDEFVNAAIKNEILIMPLLKFKEQIVKNIVNEKFWKKIIDRVNKQEKEKRCRNPE